MVRTRPIAPVRALLWGALLLTSAACRSSGGAGASPAPAADSTAPPALAERPDPNVATADQWQGIHAARVEELFAARFPGVRVVQTPRGLSIRLRGATSVYGSNEPLVVIDGMPIEPESGGLAGINPADIAKIEILKDAGATALYGMRGANGVVLITTKRPD